MDDDDSCVMKYIEIVPLDNNNCSGVTDIKQEPDSPEVYVSAVFFKYLLHNYSWFLLII